MGYPVITPSVCLLNSCLTVNYADLRHSYILLKISDGANKIQSSREMSDINKHCK